MAGVRGVARRWSELPAGAEAGVWVLIFVAAAGMRVYLTHLLPVGLWSKDAGSYAFSAFRWIRTGVWQTDPRRGAVYSIMIAACGKLWGSVDSIMVAQHVMGVAAVMLSALVMRLMHGRRALVPLGLCGYAYAVYGLPIYLEHMVRNETLLFFCGSVALATWYFAIRWRQWNWLWITGFAVGVLTATKNVWLPFPLIFAVGALWYYRKEMRVAVAQVLIFAVAFGAPYVGAKVFKHRTLGVDRSDEPQEGVLLYGRTAQFTKLDGGIEPEIKKAIAPQVLAYEKEVFGDGKHAPRLHNNEILKKTVVPHLTVILRSEGKTGVDLNKLCMRLAIEAIKAHPVEYVEQMGRDMARETLTLVQRYSLPDDSEAGSQLKLLKELKAVTTPDPIIHIDAAIAKLDEITGKLPNEPTMSARRHKGRFGIYHGFLMSAWLFDLMPVLLTALLLPVVIFLSAGTTRFWWLGGAAVWYFTMVLLVTVGRPLDRYIEPALPIMFYTLSTAVMMGWNALAGPGENRPEIKKVG